MLCQPARALFGSSHFPKSSSACYDPFQGSVTHVAMKICKNVNIYLKSPPPIISNAPLSFMGFKAIKKHNSTRSQAAVAFGKGLQVAKSVELKFKVLKMDRGLKRAEIHTGVRKSLERTARTHSLESEKSDTS